MAISPKLYAPTDGRNFTVHNEEPITLEIIRSPEFTTYRGQQDVYYEVQRETVPGVKVTMTQAEWSEIRQIVAYHDRCLNTNPIVRDAWQQFQMVLALTQGHE